MSRRRKKKNSNAASFLLILAAGLIMAAAVFVIVGVFKKISGDYKKLEQIQETETQERTTIEIERIEKQGWNDTDEGWKYLLENDEYAADTWLEIEGFLYHFDEQGIMTTGQWESQGQIYTCHDTKGYLKNIHVNLDYIPERKGENLNSLVQTNAFWCYLDEETAGPFKTILYRKAVDNKVKPLRDEEHPEKTTVNSMRAIGDYVYYLPKVKESQIGALTAEEKALCNTLVRMIPGQKIKEVIAEDVDGYLVLNDVIYYAQEGKIHSASSGTEMAAGEASYDVAIEGDQCYLTDIMGSSLNFQPGEIVSIGDRAYKVDTDGKIEAVTHNSQIIDGVAYSCRGGVIYAKTGGNEKALIRENYGVQSYCIVDRIIYYSAYVDKGAANPWYSQIYRVNLDGSGKTAVSEKFAGAMMDMYYFEEAGKIYGEYHPTPWKNAYGVLAAVGMDGSLLQIQDSSVRAGKAVSGNDMLELVSLRGNTLICLWNNCLWDGAGGSAGVLWSKAISLDASKTEAIKTFQEEAETTEEYETTAAWQETDAVIYPLETTQGETEPQRNTSAETEAPKEVPTVPVLPETISPREETAADEIEIIPLG